MITIDELMHAFAEGDLTRNELFARLVAVLSPSNAQAIKEQLSADPSCKVAFEEWLDDITRGAEVFAGKHPVQISTDTRSGILAWRSGQSRPVGLTDPRERSREELYEELALRMEQWMAEKHEGEPSLDPNDIDPISLPIKQEAA